MEKYIFIKLAVICLIYSCSRNSDILFDKDYIETILNAIDKGNELLEIENKDGNKTAIILDDRIYEIFIVKLNDGSIFKSNIGNLFYIYNEYYEDDYPDKIMFFYKLLNLRIELSSDIMNNLIKKNIVSGEIFILDEKVKNLYNYEGINKLKKEYTDAKGNNFILRSDIPNNCFNTIIYYFYINGYDFHTNEMIGQTVFHLK